MKLNKELLIAAALVGAVGLSVPVAQAESMPGAAGPRAEKQGCHGMDKAGCQGKAKAKDKASCQGKDKSAAKKNNDKASCSGKHGCGGKSK